MHSSIKVFSVFEDELTSSGGVPKSQHISECQYNNPGLILVLSSHSSKLWNNHNELDTVSPRYNAVCGVHHIEPRCEDRRSKCVVALYRHVQTYNVYTNYAVSLSIGWKFHHECYIIGI